MRHIVVGVDSSEESVDAVRYAAGLAKDTGARLIVVHVRTVPPMWSTEFGPEPSVENYSETMEQLAREQADDALAGSDIPWEFRTVAGDPADALEREAERSGADLVVVGSTGKGGVQRLLLGSVSTRLVHHAHRPVLVVRKPAEK